MCRHLLLILAVLAVSAQAQTEASSKSIPELIVDLKSTDRDASDAARWELGKRGKAAVPELLGVISDVKSPGRWPAVIALGMTKDAEVVPELIRLLDDDRFEIRGAAAYGLSQTGGQDAKDALVIFLQRSFERDHDTLNRATESLKELPDRRALPILIKIVRQAGDYRGRPSSVIYAAEALGKIGDPSAAEPLARLLDPSITYVNSQDYIFLDALTLTKGKEAEPDLIRYLSALTKRIKDQPWYKGKEDRDSNPFGPGAGPRQRWYDHEVFMKTVQALESVSGTSSKGATPSEIVEFWLAHQP
jgi:HEAT repeat protein